MRTLRKHFILNLLKCDQLYFVIHIFRIFRLTCTGHVCAVAIDSADFILFEHSLFVCDVLQFILFGALEMSVLSKYFQVALNGGITPATCKDIVHPHTDSCLLAALEYFFKPILTTIQFFIPLFMVSVLFVI